MTIFIIGNNVSLATIDTQIVLWIFLLDAHMAMMTVMLNVSVVLFHLTPVKKCTMDLPSMTVVHLLTTMIAHHLKVRAINVVDFVVHSNESVLMVGTFYLKHRPRKILPSPEKQYCPQLSSLINQGRWGIPVKDVEIFREAYKVPCHSMPL